MVRSFYRPFIVCGLLASACTPTPHRTEETETRAPTQTLATAVEAVAEGITKGFPETERIRVAILPLLTELQEETRLGKYVAEALTTRLQRSTKCTVIERSHIDRVFMELQLQASELSDPASAARLGQVLGAYAVCTGTLTDLGNVVELNLRSIEVETSAVLTTAHAAFEKTAHVASMLVPLRSPATAPTPAPSSPPKARNPTPSSGCVPAGIPLDYPGVGVVQNRTRAYTLRVELEGCETFFVPPGAHSPPLYIPLDTARQLTVTAFLAATGDVVGKPYYETLRINPALPLASSGWSWDRGFGDASFR